jgi:hypothetical protein
MKWTDLYSQAERGKFPPAAFHYVPIFSMIAKIHDRQPSGPAIRYENRIRTPRSLLMPEGLVCFVQTLRALVIQGGPCFVRRPSGIHEIASMPGIVHDSTA